MAGSLLVKVKDTDSRVAIRPWLRNRPVGLVDILRSDKRYQRFQGQEPGIHVHIGTRFRDNAIHYARRSDTSSLIVLDPKHPLSQCGHFSPELDLILPVMKDWGITNSKI